MNSKHLADAHRARTDSEWLQLIGEPRFRDPFAVAHRAPGTIRHFVQALHQHPAEEPSHAAGGEQISDANSNEPIMQVGKLEIMINREHDGIDENEEQAAPR